MARPTSPHLQIYRWHIGSSVSILHRLTGIALAFGLIALCYWLVCLAGGESSYGRAARLFASPLGRIGLAGWSFAFLFHLLSGVRHLCCDVGLGFGRAQRHAGGWFALLGALVLTLGLWAAIWRFGS